MLQQLLAGLVLVAASGACIPKSDVELSACWPTCEAGPTDPCQRLSCVRGTCRVDASGEAWCDCEAGSYPVSRTECAISAVALGRCDSSTCPPGQLCRQETGRCDMPLQSECGATVSDGGTALLYAPCARGVPGASCAAGLTCAPRTAFLEMDAGAYAFLEGVCVSPCDPCRPTCPQGMSCILLSGKGGYCSPGPLKGPGERCDQDTCNAGLTCTASVCGTPCRPNDKTAWASRVFQTEFPSDDCPAGERCSLSIQHIEFGSSFTCKPSAPFGTGERCSDRCAAPNTCVQGYSLCSVDCSESPCPDGVSCFVFTQDITRRSLCVRDGAVDVRRQCAADRNCRPGLMCSSGQCAPP